MSCSITCSTSPFTVLFAPLSHHLLFLDLFPYCSFLTNWTLFSIRWCFCLWAQQPFADPLFSGEMESATSWDKKKRARPVVITRRSRPAALFFKENDSPDSCIFIWTKLLIILQNIPKLCFISSKCHIPVLPESADDLCSSQGTIENNMLIKDNENLYPDRIFSVKINAGLMLSAIQLLG